MVVSCTKTDHSLEKADDTLIVTLNKLIREDQLLDVHMVETALNVVLQPSTTSGSSYKQKNDIKAFSKNYDVKSPYFITLELSKQTIESGNIKYNAMLHLGKIANTQCIEWPKNSIRSLKILGNLRRIPTLPPFLSWIILDIPGRLTTISISPTSSIDCIDAVDITQTLSE